MQNPSSTKPSENLLQGAAAIAEYLGGKWTPTRVYTAHARKHLPLHKRPGFGLYAFKDELDDFFRPTPKRSERDESR